MEWLTNKFELSRSGASNIRTMEGMRGFAVFLVFMVHFVTLIEPWMDIQSGFFSLVRSFRTIGNAGVDLFFVLSGYLIYGSLVSRAQPFIKFISRRIERIYPTFLVVFIVYLILSFVFPQESKIPHSITEASIYIIQNLLLLPGLFPIDPMITVAWSLSYEIFYYLIMPVIIILFQLRIRSSLWRIIFFIAVSLSIAIYSALHTGPVRLIMFISGILLYEVMCNAKAVPPNANWGFAALIIGLLCTLLPINGPVGATLKTCVLFITFFIFCLTCFRNTSSWLAHAFIWTPMRWLGNMSYSYYLLHGLTLKAGFLVFAKLVPAASFGAWLFCLLLPLMFAATLISSALLFLCIERPFSLVPRKN